MVFGNRDEAYVSAQAGMPVLLTEHAKVVLDDEKI